jgi:hypothetical protein
VRERAERREVIDWPETWCGLHGEESTCGGYGCGDGVGGVGVAFAVEVHLEVHILEVLGDIIAQPVPHHLELVVEVAELNAAGSTSRLSRLALIWASIFEFDELKLYI